MNDVPHYEIWGGWCDDAEHGATAEFLETVMWSLSRAKEICREYRANGNRYAYIRDMNQSGKIIY